MYAMDTLLAACHEPTDPKAVTAAFNSLVEMINDLDARLTHIEERITGLEVMVHQSEM